MTGLSRTAIFSAVDASLARLWTNYIDLPQIHRFDNDTPIEERIKVLHDLVESGKVRYIGASSMWTYQFAMMQAIAENGQRADLRRLPTPPLPVKIPSFVVLYVVRHASWVLFPLP